MHNITVGDLTFELRHSEKRRTIGITIGRMGELVLSAPPDCPQALIEHAVQEKRRWIYTKLAQKEMLFKAPPDKEFVNGEGFYYLGRSYRLRLVPTIENSASPLVLHNERFLLRQDELERGEEHFTNWYITQGQEWLQERVDTFIHRVGAAPRSIKVQPLGYHWGSCGRNNILYFHWRTMLLPSPIIDYIVIHELVHLHERHHKQTFWERVEQAMPDYAKRKRWLAENGSRFS
jgi:predicted metal-dependent hydrolase